MKRLNDNAVCENEKASIKETLYGEIIDTNRSLVNIKTMLEDVRTTLTGETRYPIMTDEPPMSLKEYIDFNRNLATEIVADVTDLARLIGADSKF